LASIAAKIQKKKEREAKEEERRKEREKRRNRSRRLLTAFLVCIYSQYLKNAATILILNFADSKCP
jgi:hypothetical protein